MYEFNEERWDRQTADVCEDYDLQGGWLIQKLGSDPRSGAHHDRRIYLQIGNGQWCDPEFATLFPTTSAATAYAQRFGYAVGQTVEIVRFGF
jgi:hypothetical protein